MLLQFKLLRKKVLVDALNLNSLKLYSPLVRILRHSSNCGFFLKFVISIVPTDLATFDRIRNSRSFMFSETETLKLFKPRKSNFCLVLTPRDRSFLISSVGRYSITNNKISSGKDKSIFFSANITVILDKLFPQSHKYIKDYHKHSIKLKSFSD